MRKFMACTSELAIEPGKSPPFIQEEQTCEWFSGFPISAYHCRFDKDRYNDPLFEVLGVDFSCSLQKAVTKRKAEFLAGRYCARRSVERLGLNNITIGIGQHRNPTWPPSIVGSISHSDDQAAAVTCNMPAIAGIGIDIERMITPETFKNVKSQIANDREIKCMSNTGKSITLLFTLLFSAKESFFKAAYPTVGRYFGFDAISLLEIDQHKNILRLGIDENLHVELPRGMLIEVHYRVLPDDMVATLMILERA